MNLFFIVPKMSRVYGERPPTVPSILLQIRTMHVVCSSTHAQRNRRGVRLLGASGSEGNQHSLHAASIVPAKAAFKRIHSATSLDLSVNMVRESDKRLASPTFLFRNILENYLI
jgi:hypothetical protein